MKKRIWLSEIALAAFLLPGFVLPAHAAAQGTCFYFDRLPAESPGSGDPRPEEGSDRTNDAGAGFIHWNLGDTLVREIDGEWFQFRCIDQNYSGPRQRQRQCALFLCDTVIPASFGSEYVFEELSDGSHGYVFHPGPIVGFGESNAYKTSRVRSWLRQAASWSFADAEWMDTGISYVYQGSTGEGLYEQLKGSSLTPAHIGSQKMADQLFLLSIEEALEYKDVLWRFGGAAENNPDTQIGEYCKGYWLRSPMGSAGEYDTGQVYVVDLVQGNIRPAVTWPQMAGDGSSYGDGELGMTGVIGVRPAFVLPQDTFLENGNEEDKG